MPYPSLQDDGRIVTLDLHGAAIHEALDLAASAVVAAARHGRQQVKLVHGHSTSGGYGHSIKSALANALAAGDFSPHVTSSWQGTGYLTLSLRLGQTANRHRLTLRDVW